MLAIDQIGLKLKQLCWKIGKITGRSFYFDLGEGIRIKLYYNSALSSLIYHNDFESSERNFVRRFLREGDVFFDVGANIGLFSLIAAKKVGKSGCVYAFEPARTVWERLTENIAINKLSNVVPVRCALSNVTGEARLKVALDGYDAWSSLGKPSSGANMLEESVPMTTLDTFCKEHRVGAEIVMMKVDVEGWEKYVLEGGANLLSADSAPLLLLEFAEESARSAGSSCQELYQQVRDYGYKIYRYDEHIGKLVEETCAKTYSYANLICIKSPTAKQRLAQLLGES